MWPFKFQLTTRNFFPLGVKSYLWKAKSLKYKSISLNSQNVTFAHANIGTPSFYNNGSRNVEEIMLDTVMLHLEPRPSQIPSLISVSPSSSFDTFLRQIHLKARNVCFVSWSHRVWTTDLDMWCCDTLQQEHGQIGRSKGNWPGTLSTWRLHPRQWAHILLRGPTS